MAFRGTRGAEVTVNLHYNFNANVLVFSELVIKVEMNKTD